MPSTSSTQFQPFPGCCIAPCFTSCSSAFAQIPSSESQLVEITSSRKLGRRWSFEYNGKRATTPGSTCRVDVQGFQMKVLNPEAPAYVPGCAAAGKAGSVISDISAASAALAVKPAIAKLLIATTSDGAVDAALSTPNGLAELATCLSDNLTFEDMFDHGSRRGSVSMASSLFKRALKCKPGCSSMQSGFRLPATCCCCCCHTGGSCSSAQLAALPACTSCAHLAHMSEHAPACTTKLHLQPQPV